MDEYNDSTTKSSRKKIIQQLIGELPNDVVLY